VIFGSTVEREAIASKTYPRDIASLRIGDAEDAGGKPVTTHLIRFGITSVSVNAEAAAAARRPRTA